VQVEQLIENHPVLFHMAEDGTWPQIEEHGLLSTLALVDLFEPPADVRESILGSVRRKSIALKSDVHGPAVVRDQGPLKFLDRVLEEGTTFDEYLDLLNGRVFFWATRQRLLRLLGATRYRKHHQTVLHIDTRQLLIAHPEAELAGLNTGSVHVPNMPSRGKSTFQPIGDYPYDEWRKRPGRRDDAVVEVTVPYAVPGVRDFALRVERWHDGEPIEVLYERED
jgi:hypothetical protein